jgi:hypothetical protein
VKASPVICATLIPCADHGAICTRRHVPTGPGAAVHDPPQPVALVIADLAHPTRPAIPGACTGQPASMSGLLNELPTGKRLRLRHQLCQENRPGMRRQDLPWPAGEEDQADGIFPEQVSVPGSSQGRVTTPNGRQGSPRKSGKVRQGRIEPNTFPARSSCTWRPTRWTAASQPGRPAGLGGYSAAVAARVQLPRAAAHKLQSAILATAAPHGGTEPNLLDEVAWWQTDDF